MEHEIAVVVWNEFVAKTSNRGIDFSFNDLEKRIKETINQALSQHDVSGRSEQFYCNCEEPDVDYTDEMDKYCQNCNKMIKQ